MDMNKVEKDVIKKLESQLELHDLTHEFYKNMIGILKNFKYKISEKDCFPLCISIMKVKQNILNYCNITAIPVESLVKFSEMVCGDFLFQKYCVGQLKVDDLDLSNVITSLSEGDVKVTFDSNASDSVKLEILLKNMIAMESGDFDCYKKLRW